MARRGWFGRARSRAEDARVRVQQVPEDVATKCPNRACGQILLQKELEKDLKVCKKCQYHFRLTAQERVEMLLDEDGFIPFHFGLQTGDPLGFPDYLPKVAKDREETGLDEAVLAGIGTIDGHRAALAITDFRFRAGSMNSVVGETIVRTLEESMAHRIPAILISGSGGGARMQEGLLSLMQMPRTAAALARFDRAGLLSICVLTDPTMGGVFASWAALGDIILAEPGAMIGFSGERVAAKVQTERPPENFRTAEFAFEHGMIDSVTPRSQLRETLVNLLSLNDRRAAAAPGSGRLDVASLGTASTAGPSSAGPSSAGAPDAASQGATLSKAATSGVTP
ncbi:MAG: acetyl-CoA carboxylase carboxyl transferase subunit beta [Chloroflexi bacterium]|nr:acetyl-CoA carboxylase carboxyl transferase subunit beta [Chloroflexota bacterium]